MPDYDRHRRHDKYRDERDSRRSRRSDEDDDRYYRRDRHRSDDRYKSSHRNRSNERNSSNRRDHSRNHEPKYRSRSPPRRNERNKMSIRPTHVSQQQQETEAAKVMKWVAEEDTFALKQMKQGAIIRIKEGRSKPIDWLVANLRMIEDNTNQKQDDDVDDLSAEGAEYEIPVPYSIVDNSNLNNIVQLEKDIQEYIKLENQTKNKEFWQMMLLLCEQRKESLLNTNDGIEDSIVKPVEDDIEETLAGKNFQDLMILEDEINTMIESGDSSLDLQFWQRLLKELKLRKAKLKLEQIHKQVISERLKKLKKTQATEALRSKMQISQLLTKGVRKAAQKVEYSPAMDIPPPMISLAPFEDEGIKIQRVTVSEFLNNTKNLRETVKRLGFVPMKTKQRNTDGTIRQHNRYVVSEFSEAKKAALLSKAQKFSGYSKGPMVIPTSTLENPNEPDDTQAFFESESVAQAAERKEALLQDVGNYNSKDDASKDDNEEMFNSEENLVPLPAEDSSTLNDSNEGLIKPRFYNRVILGYEWNRYNQIHYSADNPPPKVVQGYKFNIFYPDLIDSKKAPTFSIIRNKDDDKQSNKPAAVAAGQNDTCIIKFHAGPPYQDIAFKIVDRQWDNSSHRGRRFKFENGVLQVHFKFKRVFYRK